MGLPPQFNRSICIVFEYFFECSQIPLWSQVPAVKVLQSQTEVITIVLSLMDPRKCCFLQKNLSTTLHHGKPMAKSAGMPTKKWFQTWTCMEKKWWNHNGAREHAPPNSPLHSKPAEHLCLRRKFQVSQTYPPPVSIHDAQNRLEFANQISRSKKRRTFYRFPDILNPFHFMFFFCWWGERDCPFILSRTLQKMIHQFGEVKWWVGWWVHELGDTVPDVPRLATEICVLFLFVSNIPDWYIEISDDTVIDLKVCWS